MRLEEGKQENIYWFRHVSPCICY